MQKAECRNAEWGKTCILFSPNILRSHRSVPIISSMYRPSQMPEHAGSFCILHSCILHF